MVRSDASLRRWARRYGLQLRKIGEDGWLCDRHNFPIELPAGIIARHFSENKMLVRLDPSYVPPTLFPAWEQAARRWLHNRGIEAGVVFRNYCRPSEMLALHNIPFPPFPLPTEPDGYILLCWEGANEEGWENVWKGGKYCYALCHSPTVKVPGVNKRSAGRQDRYMAFHKILQAMEGEDEIELNAAITHFRNLLHIPRSPIPFTLRDCRANYATLLSFITNTHIQSNLKKIVYRGSGEEVKESERVYREDGSVWDGEYPTKAMIKIGESSKWGVKWLLKTFDGYWDCYLRDGGSPRVLVKQEEDGTSKDWEAKRAKNFPTPPNLPPNSVSAALWDGQDV